MKCRNLSENEIRDKLPEELYKKLTAAFDKTQLKKLLQLKEKSKMEENHQRKGRKRMRNDISLQCNEKMSKLVVLNHKTEEISLKINKKNKKLKFKQENSPNFEKENQCKESLGFSRLDLVQNDRITVSKFDTPRAMKLFKHSCYESDLKKNIFDTIENKSGISISCLDEKEVQNTPSLKNYFSPYKIKGCDLNATSSIGNCVDAEDQPQTPSQDRFHNFWLPNIDSTHWKTHKYSKLKNTPLDKDSVRPFIQGTP
jgi:hypothetical protein